MTGEVSKITRLSALEMSLAPKVGEFETVEDTIPLGELMYNLLHCLDLSESAIRNRYFSE